MNQPICNLFCVCFKGIIECNWGNCRGITGIKHGNVLSWIPVTVLFLTYENVQYQPRIRSLMVHIGGKDIPFICLMNTSPDHQMPSSTTSKTMICRTI